jgi:hypothetical protein
VTMQNGELQDIKLKNTSKQLQSKNKS